MSICTLPPSIIAIPSSISTRSGTVQLARVKTIPSLRHRLAFSSRIYSSKPSSGADGSDPPDDDIPGKFLPGFHPQPHSSRKAVSVFVTLPPDIFNSLWLVTRRQLLSISLRSLASCGVEGVVVEFWWGIVERDSPGVYDWAGYSDVVQLAQQYGLKVLAMMTFHQYGKQLGD